MPLRSAQHFDLPTIAGIYAAAFWDEEVMGQLMHPYRHKYPHDFLRFWLHRVSEWYWSYSHQILVSYDIINPGDGGGEDEQRLTGVADWIRHGDGCEHVWGVWERWDPLVAMQNRISLLLYPNRASDPAISDLGSIVQRLTSHLWSGPRSNGWYLNYLAVRPDFQNHGFGTSLATWGVERARKENIAASVISGVGKDPFYRRCGFTVEVGKASDGEGNPLQGRVGGGTILF
ncbi:MAG: hypothetical protein Q9219_007292 [cf. Caloplaca sp. 3 TL-2023]